MIRKPGAKAIVCHGNKILLVLRDNNPNISYPNTWNAPGGGIEEGETPAQAVIRELREEVNLITTEIIDAGSTTYSDGSIVYRFFVPISDEQLQEVRLVSEGQRLDWFTMEEVMALESHSNFSPHLGVYVKTFAEDLRLLLAGKRDFIPKNTVLKID